MRLSGLSLGLAIVHNAAHASQIPFQTSSKTTDTVPARYSQWADLNAQPDVNATSHLIFDNVNSLLQHWPHTRYRNGHSIIAGTVPVGTLLYHGRADSKLPTVPEWTATDPEHSYPFCGTWDMNSTITGCWHLTLVATRPLKVLYFDGSSAANIKDGGTLDAQDLLVWGKVDPERWVDERSRINDLCAWGKDFGLDGFVRMEMDFEVMVCDFSEGVELVSSDFLASWWSRHITPPLWRPNAHSTLESNSPPLSEFLNSGDDDFAAAAILRFESVRAGAWHDRYPGDTRVVLDLTRFISFYDTALAPSLISQRYGIERWDHRVAQISKSDLTKVKGRVGEILARGPGAEETGSGVDWQTLYRVVLDRYADRLEMVEYLLNSTTPDNVNERARVIQRQLRIMLTPYILYSARPNPQPDAVLDDTWAFPIWQSCATKHTSHIHSSAMLQSRLTASERLLLRALDETNHEICRVVVRMWVGGVRAGLDALLPLEDDRTETDPLSIVQGWRADSHALMAWLDWGVWVKCRPACGVEETCYLPTWPFFWDRINDPQRKDERWKRPQPRCIRKFEPYSQL